MYVTCTYTILFEYERNSLKESLHTYAGLAELIISQRFINSSNVKRAIDILIIIPNTAVFGPTKLIETIASTTTTSDCFNADSPFGHRRNLQPKSSSEIFIRAVVVVVVVLAIVSISLVGPNTAVFGIK